MLCFFFFFNATATTEIYTLSLHDALPIYAASGVVDIFHGIDKAVADTWNSFIKDRKSGSAGMPRPISYAVFCLKKKKIISALGETVEIWKNPSSDANRWLILTLIVTLSQR